MTFLSNEMNHLYDDNLDEEGEEDEVKHKQEGKARQNADKTDREKVIAVVQSNLHPLECNNSCLINSVTGRIAPEGVNVAESMVIAEKMVENFVSSLPGGFHKFSFGNNERKKKGKT